MNVVDSLIANARFRTAFATIDANEATRCFCRHGLDHALDVARIAWILVLENDRSFPKETVYLAALLHDIGRSESDADHDAASVQIARSLLSDCSAHTALIDEICDAIGTHRVKDSRLDPRTATLGELLAIADKKSRPCWRCAASDDCYWPKALKNHTISY